MIEVTIEEFEQGAWIADLVDFVDFEGSINLEGITFTGTKVSQRIENQKFYTRVIGGSNGISKSIADKYYNGNISVQSFVQDVCSACGETFGSAQAGFFLSTFERIRGTAAVALDNVAAAFNLIWWIDRDGKVNMLSQRPSGPEADGTRDIETADTDASVELIQPSNLQIGGTYQNKTIRHIRWFLNKNKFSARIYFVPFLFAQPVKTPYSSLYSARVDKQNGDGTVDVIADGRFGVTSVPLLSGVPHSKIKVDGGDLVTLGFFGGDPQKPFAVAMSQDTGASKLVARKEDSVKSTSGEDSTFWAWFNAISGIISGPSIPEPGSGSPSAFQAAMQSALTSAGHPSPTSITGKITSGTSRISIGD